MAITFLLEFATANRVRYRCTRAAGGAQAVEIPNAGGATPDIQTDIATAAAANLQIAARFQELMATNVANSAAGAAIMDESPEINVQIRPAFGVSGFTYWMATGRSVGAGANAPPTLLVTFEDTSAANPGQDGDFCFVDIEFVHTMVR